MERILSLDTLRMTDVARAGGKNASLGEMIGALSAAGVRVPGGFATTADALREFLARDGLAGRIRRRLAGLASNGLERGRNGLRMVMMCEVPSNAILAEEFLEHFDGFSIGSNDLTQMTLGLDRNSELVASRFDERDPAVKALLHRAIAACRKKGKYVGICGQGPSDPPDLARWLMEQGIDSVSLNPDTVVETWLYLGGEG